jgi:hypothetical protein
MPNSTAVRPMSKLLEGLLDLLGALERSVSSFPPQDHANSRFGNVSFRQWIDHTQDVRFSIYFHLLSYSLNLVCARFRQLLAISVNFDHFILNSLNCIL